MERRDARARVYSLLALPLGQHDEAGFEAIAAGQWIAELREALREAGVDPAALPTVPGAPRPLELVRREHREALEAPGHPVRPIESLYKPWTSDPTAELPMAREKGWLGGDPAAHMRVLYSALEIEVPAEFAHAPDHLALELEFMALLAAQAAPEQQDLFRSQHLDWLDDLAAAARQGGAPAFYQELLALTAWFVAHDRP